MYIAVAAYNLNTAMGIIFRLVYGIATAEVFHYSATFVFLRIGRPAKILLCFTDIISLGSIFIHIPHSRDRITELFLYLKSQ